MLLPAKPGVRARLKGDGTGGEVKGKRANGVGSQYSCTLTRNMVLFGITFFCGAATQRGSWPPHS